MRKLNFLKKTQEDKRKETEPYKDSTANFIYNMIFCDNLELFRPSKQPYPYPLNILLADGATVEELQQIIDNTTLDPRIKILAYNKQLAMGHQPSKAALLGVIVEVGMNDGLDVLASYCNGAARYLSHAEKITVWETKTDATANAITSRIFENGNKLLGQTELVDRTTAGYPTPGNARITMITSTGLYAVGGPMDTLANSVKTGTIIMAATELVVFLKKTQPESK